eukprot:CAMPEP_0201484194 /NCGR_PEP_ID=MMETSP0151_2-20130828/8399_1 /ASSEMBLY_ACC=CAM_ASM_000257 /TAXON_ID=200890 /ORGANISM="Paramoeba atlantica, Strain 621/1 / CCAP 1560/9" /LENGTH=98 /DNA_ID=CAMNT_0047867745 /DNA_START=293 /DNA_END=587 /DNA_ORIENTATION=+
MGPSDSTVADGCGAAATRCAAGCGVVVEGISNVVGIGGGSKIAGELLNKRQQELKLELEQETGMEQEMGREQEMEREQDMELELELGLGVEMKQKEDQ